MPAKIKNSFKTWMLVYAIFTVALAAARLGGEPQAAPVSPGTYPSDIIADHAFFTPALEHPWRDDI